MGHAAIASAYMRLHAATCVISGPHGTIGAEIGRDESSDEEAVRFAACFAEDPFVVRRGALPAEAAGTRLCRSAPRSLLRMPCRAPAADAASGAVSEVYGERPISYSSRSPPAACVSSPRKMGRSVAASQAAHTTKRKRSERCEDTSNRVESEFTQGRPISRLALST